MNKAQENAFEVKIEKIIENVYTYMIIHSI